MLMKYFKPEDVAACIAMAVERWIDIRARLKIASTTPTIGAIFTWRDALMGELGRDVAPDPRYRGMFAKESKDIFDWGIGNG